MKILSSNKVVAFQYEIVSKYETGISLLGPEVKQIKKGQMSLNGSFVTISNNNEMFLLNANIPKYDKNTIVEIDETRKRKLLMKKSEIIKISSLQKKTKLVLIPSRVYENERGLIKLELCLAKGIKKFDKREKEKNKESKIELRKF